MSRVIFYGERWNTLVCINIEKSTIRKKIYRWNKLGESFRCIISALYDICRNILEKYRRLRISVIDKKFETSYIPRELLQYIGFVEDGDFIRYTSTNNEKLEYLLHVCSMNIEV